MSNFNILLNLVLFEIKDRFLFQIVHVSNQTDVDFPFTRQYGK